jgi:hypothetical protein
MNLTYKERQELNELSKKAFGTSSKWNKLVTKGHTAPFERKREVMVPRADGHLEKKTFTDVQHQTQHYTVDAVRAVMVKIIVDREAAEKAVNDASAALVHPDVQTPSIPENVVVENFAPAE